MIGFVLWILCLFAVPQSATNYCDPPAPVKEELKKLAKLRDEDLAVKTSRERQLAILQEMLKKYPGDFHVHRR